MTSPSLSQKDLAELRERFAEYETATSNFLKSSTELNVRALELARHRIKRMLLTLAPDLLALASQSLEREAQVRREERERCYNAKITIPQRAFATGSDDYLRGLNDGALMQLEAVRALSQQPDKDG